MPLTTRSHIKVNLSKRMAAWHGLLLFEEVMGGRSLVELTTKEIVRRLLRATKSRINDAPTRVLVSFGAQSFPRKREFTRRRWRHRSVDCELPLEVYYQQRGMADKARVNCQPQSPRGDWTSQCEYWQSTLA